MTPLSPPHLAITELEYRQFSYFQESTMIDTFKLYKYVTIPNSFGVKEVNLVPILDNNGNDTFKCGFYHIILIKPNGKNGHGYNFNSLMYRLRIPYTLPNEILEQIKFGRVVSINSRKFIDNDILSSNLRNTFRIHKEYISSGHIDYSLLSEQIES